MIRISTTGAAGLPGLRPKPMNSPRNTTNGDLRAMIHELIDSDDGARIQLDLLLHGKPGTGRRPDHRGIDPDIQEGSQRGTEIYE